MSLIPPHALDELVAYAAEVPPGAFVEVGVYQGGSAVRLMEVAREQVRDLWLFDTFTGIPESTPNVDVHQVGDFGDTSVDAVRVRVPGAQIVVGDVRDTLPVTVTGPVAFAHLDCDQYDTYKKVIVELLPRMVPGGVMWFDDYRHLNGAQRAVNETVSGVEWSPCRKAYLRIK